MKTDVQKLQEDVERLQEAQALSQYKQKFKYGDMVTVDRELMGEWDKNIRGGFDEGSEDTLDRLYKRWLPLYTGKVVKSVITTTYVSCREDNDYYISGYFNVNEHVTIDNGNGIESADAQCLKIYIQK